MFISRKVHIDLTWKLQIRNTNLHIVHVINLGLPGTNHLCFLLAPPWSGPQVLPAWHQCLSQAASFSHFTWTQQTALCACIHTGNYTSLAWCCKTVISWAHSIRNLHWSQILLIWTKYIPPSKVKLHFRSWAQAALAQLSLGKIRLPYLEALGDGLVQVFSKNKIKIIQKQTAMLLPLCCLSAVATKQRLLLSHASSERPQKLKRHEQNTQRQRDRASSYPQEQCQEKAWLEPKTAIAKWAGLR